VIGPTLCHAGRGLTRVRSHLPGLYRLTFLPEQRTQDFAGSRGNYYRLDDGSQITLHSRPVWCNRCDKVTHGEEIESIEEIDKEIARQERLAAEYWRDIARPPLPTPDAPGDRHQRERIAELQLRRTWRLNRRSPPRCIQCGSAEIVQLEHRKPVHAGHGTVVLEMIGMCSTGFNMWYFTPEGERIPDVPAA
jgi:hypothetical protein